MLGSRKGKPDPGLSYLTQAAERNAPLSVAKPGSIGREPMPRGRFLVPGDKSIIIEDLQVPGRRVDIEVGSKIEGFFHHDGTLYCFRSRVIEMDTPVSLNDSVMVRGMRIELPDRVESGNRRQIYRQSFAAVNPPVFCDVWAVPRDLLTPTQLAGLAEEDRPEVRFDDSLERSGEYRIERAVKRNAQLASRDVVRESVRGLGLRQLAELLRRPAQWQGEVADASEFGMGLVIHEVVYSRLKVFQPIVVRFDLPGHERPLEFLIELRRVQELHGGARVGGLLTIDSTNERQVTDARQLAAFALQLQRDRAKGRRAS